MKTRINNEVVEQRQGPNWIEIGRVDDPEMADIVAESRAAMATRSAARRRAAIVAGEVMRNDENYVTEKL